MNELQYNKQMISFYEYTLDGDKPHYDTYSEACLTINISQSFLTCHFDPNELLSPLMSVCVSHVLPPGKSQSSAESTKCPQLCLARSENAMTAIFEIIQTKQLLCEDSQTKANTGY